MEMSHRAIKLYKQGYNSALVLNMVSGSLLGILQNLAKFARKLAEFGPSFPEELPSFWGLKYTSKSIILATDMTYFKMQYFKFL